MAISSNAPTRQWDQKAAGAADKVAASTDKVATSADKVAASTGKARDAMGRFVKGSGDATGALGETGGALDAVTSALSSLGPEGVAVADVLKVIVTVATALVQVLWDLATTTIAISQEKDALASTFAALGPAGADGYALVDSLSAVAAALPFAEQKVLAWGKSLMAAGIQGKALETAVKAVAASTALMGDSGGKAAETLIKRFQMAAETGQQVKLDRRVLTQLAAAGVSADSLTKALGVPAAKLGTMAVSADKLGTAFQKALIEKGAGALENMSLTWDSISAKLHDGFEDLFEDMGAAVRPFMREVKALFAEFSAGSAIQSTAKSVLMSFLTGLFSLAAKVIHLLHTGFLMVAIAVLKVAILIAPLVNLFRRIYQNATVVQGIVFFFKALAVIIGIVIAVVLAVVGTFLTFAAVVGGVIGLVVAGFFWLEGVISDVVGAIPGFLAFAGEALTRWADDAYDAAANFISGLVSGIASGAGAVADAVKNVASSALSAFKSTLGIASPSRVMMAMGGHMTTGLAQGLDAGTPRVQGTAAKLGDSAAAGVAQGAQGGAGGSAGLTIGSVQIVVENSGQGARALAEEIFAAFVERLAAQQGLAQGTT